MLAYGEADISLDKEHITIQDQESDSFRKYYSDLRREKKEKVKAYQIKTLRKARGPLQVTEAVLSVKEVLAKAREYQVSMTGFFDGSIPLCDPQGDAEKTGKASGCSDGPGESSQFFSFRFDAEFLRIY